MNGFMKEKYKKDCDKDASYLGKVTQTFEISVVTSLSICIYLCYNIEIHLILTK